MVSKCSALIDWVKAPGGKIFGSRKCRAPWGHQGPCLMIELRWYYLIRWTRLTKKMNIASNFIFITLYFIERQCTKHKTVPLSRMDRKCPQERWGYLGVNRPNTKNIRTARGGRPHHSALQVNEVKGIFHCTEFSGIVRTERFAIPERKVNQLLPAFSRFSNLSESVKVPICINTRVILMEFIWWN